MHKYICPECGHVVSKLFSMPKGINECPRCNDGVLVDVETMQAMYQSTKFELREEIRRSEVLISESSAKSCKIKKLNHELEILNSKNKALSADCAVNRDIAHASRYVCSQIVARLSRSKSDTDKSIKTNAISIINTIDKLYGSGQK